MNDRKKLLIALTMGRQDLLSFGPRFDAQDLLDEAVEEDVFYPLYRNLFLLDAKEKLVSDALREKFKQTYYLYLAKSSEYISRVERVLDRLESLGIKTLVFKGPAIDAFIYDGFFRPRLDLDIAVADEQMPGLEKGLAGLGYAAQDEKDYPVPEYLNSRVFMSGSDDLVPVHVHRHLINNMFLTVDGAWNMPMAEIWKETTPFKNHRVIFMLKPELNILFLCEHGLKHDFDQLAYLVEIERLVRYYGQKFDWKKFLALAESSKLGRAAYYGLYFVKEILSVGLSEDVLGALKPKKFSMGEKRFIANTLGHQHRRYASYPVYLAMRPGVLKKIHFLYCTVIPPGFTFKSAYVRLQRLVLSQASFFFGFSKTKREHEKA